MDDEKFFSKLKKEIKSEREKMKPMKFTEKVEYFFMYYKIPFIMCTAAILLIGSVVFSMLTAKESALSVCVIGTTAFNEAETMHDDLEELLDIDTNNYKVVIDTSMNFASDSMLAAVSAEKFVALLYAGDIDVCILPLENYENYLETDAFAPLTDYLTDEQLERYADLIIYAQGVPTGIDASGFSKVKEMSYGEDEAPVFCIAYNASHPSACSEFLDYLAGYAG